MSKKVKIYFGAPLFNEPEQEYNRSVVGTLRHVLQDDALIYLPQENEAINDKSGYADSLMIYHGDNQWLDEADILIAVMDGQTMDIGLATEVGRFAHIAETSDKPKYIIGLYTDVRQGNVTSEKVEALSDTCESVFPYVNLYTVGAVKYNGIIVNNSSDLIRQTLDVVLELREND